ncbi:hypothetical protein PM082_014908 [Marasmius tenuissimus]|nr:hypothetical protein PM082_014908 [Marasmius tenuissimus]
MNGPMNGLYQFVNIGTEKYAALGFNDYLYTNASNPATFNITLNTGTETYHIQEDETGYYVGAETTQKQRRVLLQSSTFEWTFKSFGFETWNIGIQRDDVWWYDGSSDDSWDDITLKGDISGNETVWQLVPAESQD